MYPIQNLNIGNGAKGILRNRGIHFCEQVSGYTTSDLTSYGFTNEMLDTLNHELNTLGFDVPALKKRAKRKTIDWDKPMIMPPGVKMFYDGFRGECLKEDDEQVNCFNMWKLANPGMDSLFIHINNETMSNVQGYMKMIRKGMLRRAPDNLIVLPAGGHIGFACELKRRDIRKSLSSADRRVHFEEQKQILAKWAEMGMYSCVACGSEQFLLAWDDYISKIDID